MSRTILVVAPYLPLPANFGGAIRIYQLVKALSATNSVILLAPFRGDAFDEIVQLGQICDVTAVPVSATVREPASRRKRMAQFRSLAGSRPSIVRTSSSMKFQAVMDRLFQTRFIDLVQYEFPQMSIFRPSVPVPSIIDAHNIEYRLLQSMVTSSHSGLRTWFNAIEFARMRQFERQSWRQSTLNIATSTNDAGVIELATGQEVPVVPNGVDANALSKVAAVRQTPNSILFTGAMRHGPNAEGAIWFAREVLPLIKQQIPAATFTVAGADPPPAVKALTANGVKVTGTVEDIHQYLGKTQLTVVPLHAGSGTRLKILEAFAARRPVVSTSLGAEGLDVVDGNHLLIANSAREFALAVTHLLEHPAQADALAAAGQKLARERYDWTLIASELEKAQTIAMTRFYAGEDEQ